MIELRLFGVKICLDFSFFAVLLVFMLLDKSGVGIMGLYACMIHEAGHLIAMLAAGSKPASLVFYGSGFKITSPGEYRLSLAKQAFILFAGCGVNFICFALFYSCSNGSERASVFAIIHLLIGFFNLLPVGAFDGGRLASLALSLIFPPQSAFYISRCIGLAVTTGSLMLSIWLYSIGIVNFTAVATLCYITLMTMLFG